MSQHRIVLSIDGALSFGYVGAEPAGAYDVVSDRVNHSKGLAIGGGGGAPAHVTVLSVKRRFLRKNFLPRRLGEAGFGWHRSRTLNRELSSGWQWYDTTSVVSCPHWFLVALSGAPTLVLLLLQSALAGRRGRAGFCAACGYDLRATPDRCPECGRAAGAQPPDPLPST